MRTNLRTLLKTSVLACGLLAAMPPSAQSLRQAVRQALCTNPDIKFDSANRLAVGEELKQAKAGFFPTIEARAGIGRERTVNATATAVNGTRGLTLTRREASVELRQNVFDGGGNFGEVARQRSHLHSAAYKIVGTSEDVALQVSEAYINVLRYQQLVQLAKNNLADHERIVDMIRERSESGLGRKAELIQAEGRLSLARANLIAERSHLSDANTSFERVVGYKPGRLRWPKSPSRRTLPHTLARAIRTAHHNHPTLKSITADVHAAEAQHRTATSQLFPRVDVIVGAGRNKNLDGVRGINHDNYVMLRGSYTLFNGGANLARHRETIYRIQEANEVRNRTIMQMDEHVRLSWNAYRSVNNRLVYLRQHKESSQQTVDAYQEQFKNRGDRTLLDVLDSMNELYQSKLEYSNGLHDELYSRMRILNSVGGLLTYLRVALPYEAKVPETPHATML